MVYCVKCVTKTSTIWRGKVLSIKISWFSRTYLTIPILDRGRLVFSLGHPIESVSFVMHVPICNTCTKVFLALNKLSILDQTYILIYYSFIPTIVHMIQTSVMESLTDELEFSWSWFLFTNFVYKTSRFYSVEIWESITFFNRWRLLLFLILIIIT
jgi:hypothetical protein